MKNSIEIRQERATAIEKANDLLNLAKNESRDFSADEQTSYDGMMENIDKLAKDISVVERQEKLNAEVVSNPVSFGTQNVSESKEVRDYSFIDAVNAAKSNRVEGLVKEMDQEARTQNPSQNFKGVGIPSSVLESRANNTVLTATNNPTDVRSFTDLMTAASILVPAGANFYTGISASQKLPIFDSITTGFIGENGSSAATEGGTVSQKTLAPNTLIAATNVSAAALVQNSSIEAAFRKNMARAVMSKLEEALLGQADDTVASIFKTACVGTLAGPTTWAANSAITAIQTMINQLIGTNNNIDELSLLMNGGAYADLMEQVAGVAGSGFSGGSVNLVDKKVLNTPYFVSSNVGEAASNNDRARALLLDASKVHLAMFGGLDMLVDPYSQSLNGGTRLVMTALVDGQLAAAASSEAAVNCIAGA
jgi:HK97 family phage major capsid protein